MKQSLQAQFNAGSEVMIHATSAPPSLSSAEVSGVGRRRRAAAVAVLVGRRRGRVGGSGEHHAARVVAARSSE